MILMILLINIANVKASEFYRSQIVDLLLECYMDEQYDHIFQMKVLDEN